MNADLNDSLVPDFFLPGYQKKICGYKTGNMFTPPFRRRHHIFPGYDGGAEWAARLTIPLPNIVCECQ
jgi:quinoprotein glucose dehydrogenase